MKGPAKVVNQFNRLPYKDMTPNKIGDPYFANVSLLLHGDTNFIDVSPNPKTVTVAGNSAISATQSKFGGSSMYFDGLGDYLTVASSADFAFGTGDFTVEMWFYTAGKSNAALLDFRDASNTGSISILIHSNAVKLWVGSERIAVTYSYNTWVHVAVVRASGISTLYVNGTPSGTTYTDTNNYLGQVPKIATYYDFSSTYHFPGYMDEIRITKGVARYTAAFTPTTEPFLSA